MNYFINQPVLKNYKFIKEYTTLRISEPKKKHPFIVEFS